MKSPCVYIVGAGPGDPSLVSVRGRRCLEVADVVVFDHRVHPRLLRSARPDAERIDVGPAAPRALDQDAISILLVEKAREGKTVVRLKWGDPFLFDSGGKEALFLHEQGIPFEVVPGIAAAIGGPAYAGIPLTYPDAGDVVSFVRGHEGESDAPPHVEWAHLAGVGGTLVCYAGARQVDAIARALVSHGRSADEAAALIYNPTLPSQQTLAGTIGTIAGLAREDAPALLVVGRVAGLRSHLRWFDDRPLFGRRIVVTRSREQAGEFVEMLEERGAEAIMAPAIRIAPPEDGVPLDAACAEASTYDWIVFTSANGVDHFMSRLLASHDVRDLKGVRICTVGPSTAARVQRFGIRVDLTPAEFRAESIVDALGKMEELNGRRILLPRADIARDVLADALREAGADVTDVTAYRTVEGPGERESDQDLYRMLLDRQIDAVTFTSASTVRNFVNIIGREQAADLLRSTVVASIGPVTAEAAQQLDIATTVMPARYTIPDLVDALVEHFTRNPGPDTVRS
ncbi:MAG: uroporphyrinogen-III C-methyltransferase [Acidobacteria bacterium RIFCSPLOWO2_02_FULL_67_36]|nr:MAG: uroporphyrinogen-III C-methyltransferase [Acidobacteria bacterium RIFCSPLOWO2_02_FULL_67_36]OFW19094.1 MAG: uroporphyrinogen-III C-methyltransferase [Acidobacteria bacterium RIFCSPLOWO2_12_FULL_66_21]